ncbi:hypothetical protein MTR_1g059430 [Medicago truncatula]|uniref:Uncharacterized protein n=1 Tax=Medicago truncatula TaxID=3880 RepID=G7I9A5_MEDTR|nr:hypothetical protein MTR_1g059430 [Medicago truncatula]
MWYQYGASSPYRYLSIIILQGIKPLSLIELKLQRGEYKAPGHQAPNNEMLMHGLDFLNILIRQPLIIVQ